MKYVLPDEERYFVVQPRAMGKTVCTKQASLYPYCKVKCNNPRAITSVTYPKLFQA